MTLTRAILVLSTRFILPLVAAVCTAPAFAQDIDDFRVTWEESVRPARGASPGLQSDAEFASMIERLEIGMTALAEIGDRRALEVVQRVANQLREQRAASSRTAAKDPQDEERREENAEIREVRRRLGVMRWGVDAFLEAGIHDPAHQVELAMHARELAIEGVRNEEAAAVREAAPNRGELSRLLRQASELHAGWDHPDRAQGLATLAQLYAAQWERQSRVEREGRAREGEQESESRREDRLDSLEQRMKILRLARDAYAEAGRERNVKALNGAILYGELALGEAGEEKLAAAAEGVPSLGNLAELLQGAAGLYAEWGRSEREQACRSLSRYYVQRLPGAQEERSGERAAEAEHEREQEVLPERIHDLEHRMEILRMGRAAWAESGDQQAATYLERFLHVAELQFHGARGEEIGQAFEGMTIGNVIELLHGAHDIYTEMGRLERATACHQLARYYTERETGRETGRETERETGRETERETEREGEREGEPAREQERPARDLEDRAARIEVLRMVYEAYAEAGRKENASYMERVLHLARLQQDGAADQAIAQAAEGITQGNIIEMVGGARNLYRERGLEDRAAACHALFAYYSYRAQGAEAGAQERAQRERAQGQREQQLRQLAERVDGLQRELAEIQAVLHELLRR